MPGLTRDQASKLDALISECSTKFANIPTNEVDRAIEWGMEKIAKCLDLDRCTFWEVLENQAEALMTHHYTERKFSDHSLRISTEYFPYIFNLVMSDKLVNFSRVDDLPDEAAVDKASFRALGEKSVLVLAYRVAGKPITGMSFVSMKQERIFHPQLIPPLRLVGEIITSALHRKRMEQKYEATLKELQRISQHDSSDEISLRQDTENVFEYKNIVGQSLAIREVFLRMEQVAPTDSVVLILGETGSGKGVIAQAIHDMSHRKNHPLVNVNCAALPSNLIESELFGREKGAFTGSTSRQIGRFELADKGSIILDEIAELPLELQAKLLRAIQDGEFERLGSPKTIRVDTRIIALTSRNLREEVSKGRFRQDLYYRLNVFPITVPPLRERKEDIPLLADHFVKQFSRKLRKEINTISRNTMSELTTYRWPGNVRELEHIVERGVIMTQDSTFNLVEQLDEHGLCTSDEKFVTNLAEIEKSHIVKVLEMTGWRIEGSKGAAILLGLHPNTLRGRMLKLGISIKRRAFPEN